MSILTESSLISTEEKNMIIEMMEKLEKNKVNIFFLRIIDWSPGLQINSYPSPADPSMLEFHVAHHIFEAITAGLYGAGLRNPFTKILDDVFKVELFPYAEYVEFENIDSN